MRRTIAITAVSVAVILILSGFMEEQTSSEEVREESVSTEMTDTKAVGTWYLSYENDRDAMDAVFPDIFAFGSELTITPEGKIYWHVGAAGAAGTYESFGNQLLATVSDIMEYDEYRIAITLSDDGKLLMKYRSLPLVWTR